LRYYLVGLVFAGIDWPLNYAFYAQQDTLTPALVGVLSVVVYLVVALSLLAPLGMLGLVLADSAKHCSHAVTMLVLGRRRFGGLGDLGLWAAGAKALLAAAAMGAAISICLAGVNRLWPGESLGSRFLAVALPGACGVLVYLAGARLLRLQELMYLGGLVRLRLRGRRFD
jgi:putative peptidoglycan lipid II flippase